MCMRIKSTIDLSALNGYVVQFSFFLKGNIRLRETERRERTPGIKKHLSVLGFIEYMEVDITVQCGGGAISKAFTTGRSYVTGQPERQ